MSLMKRLLLLTLLTLASCGPAVTTRLPSPVTAPPPPVVVAPVETPQPTPVAPPVSNLPKNFEKMTNVPNLCEVFVRPDEQIETRFWLHTKDCNGYVLVKWFTNLTDERSTTYIGLVGNGTEGYIDTLTNGNNLVGYIQGTDPNGADLEHVFDVGRVYYPLYKVQLAKKTY